jgi:G3E family GTPase
VSDPAVLAAVTERIQHINPLVTLHQTTQADLDLALVMNIGGFDLQRANELDPHFTHLHDNHHDDHGHDAHYHTHTHDDEITSVGIELTQDLDPMAFQRWLGNLLQTQGQHIYRMKGIVAMAGHDERFVFQGVHMLLDGRPDKPWGDTPRHSRIIFIGKHLDRQALQDGINQCLAKAAVNA